MTFAKEMYDYPEFQPPTLIEGFRFGTILLFPYIALILIWLGSIIALIFKRQRGIRVITYLITFPVAFALLAIAQWAYAWQFNYVEMLRSGPMDPLQYARDAILISHSTLIIAITGFFTLLGSVFFLILPPKNQKGEQASAGNP